MSKLLHCTYPFLFLLTGFVLPLGVNAQYKISGQLNNYDSLWINQISLSAINSTSQLYYSDADIIINKDSLDKEGQFTISGNNLPDDNRIYRLTLNKQKNTLTMFRTPSNSNFIFLILNNHSSVNINSPDFSKSSYDFRVEGSAESSALQRFEKYLSQLNESLKPPSWNTKMTEEYSTDKFNNSIRSYCDTCRYPIVALAGISEIIDFDKDYAQHRDFYNKFLSRMKALSNPASIYLKEFEKNLNLLDYQNHTGASKPGYLTNPLVYIEGIIILLLLGIIGYLQNKIKKVNKVVIEKAEPDRKELFETLTRREREILSLLIEDIQNKEIANKLNLEVSTIKTHIGKIYQKLAINNRNEVKAYEAYLPK